MGKGSAKQEVTEYYMSIHAGIGAGEFDSLMGLYIGEKLAWSGDVRVETAIPVNASELFGGIKKEGGAGGILYYLPGGRNQVLPEALAKRLGRTSATCPGFRGFASVFFVGQDNFGSVALPGDTGGGGTGDGGGTVGGGGGGGGVSGGGGGGRGGYCVVSDSWLPGDIMAAQISEDTHLMILDYSTMDRVIMARCIRRFRHQDDVDCVRIVTKRGVELCVSEATPLTLQDRSVVNVLHGIGAEIPTVIGNDFRWDPIMEIVNIGKRRVTHIDAGGLTFAAGQIKGRWALTHNLKQIEKVDQQ